MHNLGGAAPARHIFGNYEIFEEIGRGGMGIVYRALDLSLDRIVALKVLRDDLQAQPQIVSRFAREARAAASLEHPNIADTYAVGQAKGTHYIAMEFLDADPLSEILYDEGPLPWRRAFHIAGQIASALACAHEAQIIHRDIKPSNILIDGDKAYVTDFGIAKILTVDDGLTVDGSRLGTPHYMAPERCQNEEATAASDLYALGVLLYQMVTGHLPFDAPSSGELIRQILSTEAPRVRTLVADLPEDVERLIAWLLEKDPKARPASALALRAAMQRVRRGLPLDDRELSAAWAVVDFRNDLKSAPLAPPAPARETRQVAYPPQIMQALAQPVVRRWNALPKWLRWSYAAYLGVFTLVAGGLSMQPPDGAVDLERLEAHRIAEAALWETADPVTTLLELDDRTLTAASPLSTHAPAQVRWAGDQAYVYLQPAAGGPDAIWSVNPGHRRGAVFAAPDAAVQSESQLAFAGTTEGIAAIFPAADGSKGMALWQRPLQDTMDDRSWIMPDVADVSAMAFVPSGAFMAFAHPVPGKSLVMLSTFSLRTGETVAIPRTEGSAINAIQVAPESGSIAFVRGVGNGQRLTVVRGDQQWVIQEASSISIMDGAFDRTGTRIVFAATDASGAERVYVAEPGITAMPAVVSEGRAAAWLANASGIVTLAKDDQGAPQLFRVLASDPANRVQLTHLPQGIQSEFAVNDTGTWAAAISGGELVLARTR